MQQELCSLDFEDGAEVEVALRRGRTFNRQFKVKFNGQIKCGKLVFFLLSVTFTCLDKHLSILRSLRF